MNECPVVNAVLSLLSWGGKLPTTVEDWQNVATHYAADLHIVQARGSVGVTLDEIIVVRESSNQGILNRRIAHEMTEYLLTTEYSEPFIDQVSRHQIASQVESFY